MRTVAIIPLLLANACGGGAKSEPEPEPAAATREDVPVPDVPEGFVVLRASAPLHRRPSAEAPSSALQLGEETHAAFEVVGNEGEWIRIRNLDANAGAKHCVRGWEALEHFEIDFWVRKSDLERVTRRSVVTKFGDGTSAMLAAGTPVSQSGAVWTAVGPGASAQLPLRADSVGSFYEPAALHEPGKVVGTLPRATPLLLGSSAIDNAALLGKDAIDLYESVRRDDGTLVTVGTRCVELEALLRGRPPSEMEAIEDTPSPDAPHDETGPRWTFSAGAKVFWDDGEPAGKVVATHVFTGYASVDSDRRCFDHAGLQLCLRAEDGTHQPR